MTNLNSNLYKLKCYGYRYLTILCYATLNSNLKLKLKELFGLGLKLYHIILSRRYLIQMPKCHLLKSGRDNSFSQIKHMILQQKYQSYKNLQSDESSFTSVNMLQLLSRSRILSFPAYTSCMTAQDLRPAFQILSESTHSKNQVQGLRFIARFFKTKERGLTSLQKLQI